MSRSFSLANVSVYVDRSTHETYTRLVNHATKNADDYPFATMKDLFLAAACVGAATDNFKAFTGGRDIFSGVLFDSKTDVPILQALAYSYERDFDSIRDPKRVIEIAQGWANGGLPTLQRLLFEHGRPLDNLTTLALGEVGLTETYLNSTSVDPASIATATPDLSCGA